MTALRGTRFGVHLRPSKKPGTVYPPDKLLCADPTAKLLLEARNGLQQFEEILRLASERFGSLNLTPSDIKHLQRVAVKDIYLDAGEYRTGPIAITNAPHRPPPHSDVERLVEEMCEYANGVSDRPLHCASYLLWRLNWIHPFGDGNGRTARAISYLAMCALFSMILPGTVTVPDMIAKNKPPYYDGLDAADDAFKRGGIDVSVLEALLNDLLTKQLKTSV